MSKSKRKCCPFFDQKSSPQLFKALGDSNRISILNWLAEKAQPCNVKDISSCCNVDLSVISRHLKTLKEAGVLASEKHGKEVLYAVNARELAGQLRSMADSLENCCVPKKKKGGQK